MLMRKNVNNDVSKDSPTSSKKENYTSTENRNELNVEQKFRHNIIAICDLVLDMFREL